MSQTIDYRVVEMKFDNKQFEKGAATTMSTLDKLKKSLDFSKIGDSFSNITKSAKKVDMSGLDNAITTVRNKFSALEVMAITTLGNVTNSFVNSAKRWASSFTIDPIKTGFQEYETQINAVQTILANTQKEGTNIKDVNAALDELNLYADKTIYNFTEMTRNIGTFTAAGVDLKTSVNAIQGIANLAAVSGSNSQQAATAMYQLSQALSSGTIRLMDWNSVVNAGMGGQLFQDALKETSRLLGTGVDAAIEAEGSFRESLSAGWLTAEVLTETLKKFTTSGAAEYVANYTGLTKEAITSELELAKTMYGEANAIDRAAEALANKSGKNKDEIAEALRFAQTAEDAATKVKTFTQLIDTLKEALQSGWSQSFRIIVGDFEEAKELFTEISDAFGAVIGASSDARNKLLTEVFVKKDLQDYMASVVDIPKEAIAQLQIVEKEAGSTSDLFKNTLKEFTKGDETLNKVMTDLVKMANSGKDVVSYISDVTGMTEDSITELQNIGDKFGYTSIKFQTFMDTLTNGSPEMEETILNLLKMNDAMQKPSGRELLIDSLRNGMKGLLSIVKPVQEAFNNVFPQATADQIYGILESFHEFTKTLRLSKKNSDNLKNAFEGLFNFVKLLSSGFKTLVKLIIPIEKPAGSLADLMFDLLGGLGKLLTSFSNGARSSKLLAKAFEILQGGSSKLLGGLSSLIELGNAFIKRFSKMEGVTKLINSVTNAFDRLYKKVEPYIEDFVARTGELFDSWFNFENINIDDTLNSISEAFIDLSSVIDRFSFQTVIDAFNTLKEKIKELLNLSKPSEGLSTFSTNFNDFGKNLKKSLSLDDTLDRLELTMSVFSKFFNWVKTTMGPAFENFSVLSGLATAGGFGIIYAMIKASQALEKISAPLGFLGEIPKLLGGVRDSLISYQKKLKAETLLKISAAIAVLVGALVLLSFADTKKVMEAAFALTLIGGTLALGISKIIEALNKGHEANKALDVLASSVSGVMKKLGKAIQIKALGSAMKDFAKSIAIIAVSIIALGIMYSKDKEALMAGVDIVKNIGIALVGIMAVMTMLGDIMKNGGMKNFAIASFGILALSTSLTLCIIALNRLFKMEFPSDWDFKVKVLAGVLVGLGALAIALGYASKIAKNNKLAGATILAMAALLMTTVIALDKLFKMEIPSDWGVKVLALVGIFALLAGLMIAVGQASKLAGGSIKAAGTILAMCVFIGSIVTALMILSIIPGDKMIKGAISLGTVLVSLGAALYGAGKISSKDTNKSVLAMAIVVGAITASLALISMIPFKRILTGVVSLGSILLIMAETFKQVSKITNKNSWASILAMTGAIVTISLSLFVLSLQPWERLLAAGAALSAVLLSFSGAFFIISKTKPDLMAMATFLAASASVGLIALAIYGLSTQPWENLLAASASLSLVLLAMSGAMAICSLVGAAAPAALIGIGLLDLFIVNLALVLAALGYLYQSDDVKNLMTGGTEFLIQLGSAIGGFVGAIIGSTISGIASTLPKIATDLSNFMTNLQPFIAGSKTIDAGALACVGFLAGIIIALTVSEFVNGIASLFGMSLVDVAEELSEFMKELQPFINRANRLKPESMKACEYLAKAIIALTAAEMISGISKFLGFGGSISEFGEELKEFGPAISEFADTVKDVKPEAVEGASAAADIMANVAKKLPRSDGLIQKIFGKKSLKQFGEELLSFGPSITTFADIVKDVKPEAVEGAAAAAEIMTTLADKLPESDSLWDKLFGGGTISFTEFGEDLVAFGTSMTKFSKSVASVQVLKINSVLECFEDILRISEYVQNSSASELVTFANQLNEMGSSLGDSITSGIRDALPNALFQMIGQNVVQGLIIGISSNGTVLIATINDMLTVIVGKFRMELTTVRFVTIGQNAIQGLITGFGNRKDILIFAVANLLTAIINKFRTDLSSTRFIGIGQNVVVSLAQGIDSDKERINIVITQLCTYIIQSFTSYLNEWTFRDIGENAALGLKYGIESKVGEISDAAVKAANEAVNSAKNALKVKSPSRVAWEIGEYFSLGLAGGILEKTSSIETSSLKAADKVANPIKRAVDIITEIINSGDFDITPVVRPVMDLSNVQKGANDISSLMNRKYDLSSTYNRVMDTSASFAKPKQAKVNNDAVNSKSGEGDTYQFNQYNYSPKALSRSEIYRQTNNQFSAFRRAVNPT